MLSMKVLQDHKEKFGVDFTKNKQALNDICKINSKALKNKLAGYITKFIKNVQLRLYTEKNDEKLGPYSQITSLVETDKGSVEMIYDEGFRGNNALETSSKFLTENLGISSLILRSLIFLDGK